MTGHRHPARLALAAAAAAALAASLLPGSAGAAGAVGGAAAQAPSAAVPGEPSVSLTGSAGEMWAFRNSSSGDLGVRLSTVGGRVELRTRRVGWDQQPETRYFPGGWTTDSVWDDGQPVPRSLMRGFDRLRGLVEVVVRRADGTGPKVERSIDGCLNTYEPVRLGPDSPDDPYYPGGCPWNPFTVASVQGVEAGYASAVSEWTRLPVGTGRYTVRARLGEAWAELFDVAPEDRSVTYPLTVKGSDDGGYWSGGGLRSSQQRRAERAVPPADPGPRPAPARSSGQMADMDGMSHSAATLPCGYEPTAGDPLPDLESLPAFGIESDGKNLSFSATVWNSGDSPLVVDGFRRDGQELMDAYQYFYTRDDDGELEYEPGDYCGVGAMHWHAAPSHNHWHFLDFARYRLLSVKDPGKVVRSTKQSFCLANTDAVDYTRPGADWRPEGTDLSSACGSRSARSLRQVLSAGSGDTYGQYRAGQAFRLAGLPNGWYDISVEANPRDLLHEADEDASKDVALRRVWIGTRADGTRSVKVPPVGLVCGQMGRACD